MKLLLAFTFLFGINFSFSQKQVISVGNLEESSPALLAKLITANDSTDFQKVKSIFAWITNNIAYNVKSFQNNGPYSSNDYWLEETEDTSAVLKPLNERIAEQVLLRRTAVCDGYSRLFKVLCDQVNIPCEVITGYGRTNMNRVGTQFRCNHKWNAVYIDSNWFLLDATWASGYINYRNEFEKEYNPHYFLTPPDAFLLDHYPEDPQWTLLASPPIIKEFSFTPFKTASFNTHYVSSFKPETGTIEAAVGDSIVFEIETRMPGRTLWVTDIPYIDSNGIYILQCCGMNKPVNTVNGNKVSYTYRVTSENSEWLNVIYDDELLMRYKLNIKKDRLSSFEIASPK